MGEYFCGVFTIGGRIENFEALTCLAEALYDSNAVNSKEEARAGFLRGAATGLLEVEFEEMSWSGLDVLEDSCRELALPFSCFVHREFEIEECVRAWSPGWENIVEVDSVDCGMLAVPFSKLRHVEDMEELQRILQTYQKVDSVLEGKKFEFSSELVETLGIQRVPEPRP